MLFSSKHSERIIKQSRRDIQLPFSICIILCIIYTQPHASYLILNKEVEVRKAWFRCQTFHELKLIQIKVDPNYLDRLKFTLLAKYIIIIYTLG